MFADKLFPIAHNFSHRTFIRAAKQLADPRGMLAARAQNTPASPQESAAARKLQEQMDSLRGRNKVGSAGICSARAPPLRRRPRPTQRESSLVVRSACKCVAFARPARSE